MEAVRASQTSVYFETTWYYIPEGCHLGTFYAHSQVIPEAEPEQDSHNNRIETPTEGNKGAEPPDDEDEGVGEEGDHDEDYRRQMEEVQVHSS
jgi:hypothetical protein